MTDCITEWLTDQCAENEENHEESAESRLAVHVAVADRRHRNESEVDAIPVRQRVRVGEVGKRVARVLHLKHNNILYSDGMPRSVRFCSVTPMASDIKTFPKL